MTPPPAMYRRDGCAFLLIHWKPGVALYGAYERDRLVAYQVLAFTGTVKTREEAESKFAEFTRIHGSSAKGADGGIRW